MPFQPTYPTPYNVGENINSDEGISFECTIDEYDTIYNAEFFLKDVSTNKEILKIVRNSGEDYKRIVGVSGNSIAGLSDGTYDIQFPQANLPYIYELSYDSSKTDEERVVIKNNEPLQSGTQYYDYSSTGGVETFTPFSGTYTGIGYIVWGPINSFKSEYDYQTLSTEGTYDYLSKKIDIDFNNGVPVLSGASGIKKRIYDYLTENTHPDFTSVLINSGYLYILPPYTAMGYQSGKASLYNSVFNVEFNEQGKYKPYTNSGFPPSFYREVNFDKVIDTTGGAKAPIFNVNYFTDVAYRRYENYTSPETKRTNFGSDFTEIRRREYFLIGDNQVLGISSIKNKTLSKPLSLPSVFLCPQTIGFGLVKKSAVNSNDAFSYAGTIALVNPGFGYSTNKTYTGKMKNFQSSEINVTITNMNANSGIIENLSATNNSTLNRVNFYSDQANTWGPYPSLPVYFPPPDKPQGTMTIEGGEVTNFSLTGVENTGYLIPPNSMQYRVSGGGGWHPISSPNIKIELGNVDYYYSADGGKTYNPLTPGEDSLFETSDFPITGGRGEESRLFIKLDFYKMDLPEAVLDNLKTARLAWYLRLIGDKNDVYIYSGQGFKTTSPSESTIKYAVLPNNSNIAEGAVIYRNYKDTTFYSQLTNIENQFAGLNISAVESVDSSASTYFTVTLRSNEYIEIPETPYISASVSIMDGMKCLLNGLEYEVASLGLDNGKVKTIRINKTSSAGETINPDAILENMRVELYRDKCIAYLQNQAFTLQEYETYTIWSNSILTQQYYFETNEGQNVTFECTTNPIAVSLENNLTIDSQTVYSYDSCNLTFIGGYSGEVLYHKWELYESMDGGTTFNLIKDTGEVYSTDLSIEYKGLSDRIYNGGINRIYKLKLIVSNNLSQTVEAEQYFYIEAVMDAPVFVDATTDCNKMAAAIDLTTFEKEIVFEDVSLFLSEFIIYKNNTLTSTDKQEIFVSGDTEIFYDYALANYNDYVYEIRAIYEIWEDDVSLGKYGYIDGLHTLVFSSSEDMDEDSAFEGEYTIIGLKSAATELTKLIIPKKYQLLNITSIGEGAFKDNTNLQEIRISDNIVYIDEEAFYNCENLSKLIIPSSIKNIPVRCFAHSGSGINTTQFQCYISEGVEEIGNTAFLQCTKLTQIYLPHSLKKIGNRCFASGTSPITTELEVYYGGTEEEWNYLLSVSGSTPFYGRSNVVYHFEATLTPPIITGEETNPSNFIMEYHSDLFDKPISLLKYFWSKLLIIDTQKRLSESTEEGQYFISTDPNSKWDFQLGIEDSDISITTDSGVYDGLYEFPIVNETYRNYKTQSLSCKLGKIDDSTEWRYGRSSVDIVNKWKKFCNNGHVKILRDRFGNLVPVKVTAKSYKCNNTKPMIIDLAFDWTQLASEEGLFAVELSQGEVNT